MSQSAKRQPSSQPEPVRVLGRGIGAARGVRLSLKSLREASGKTQVDVARHSRMDQSDVSRLESRAAFDDCLVDTLRRYVEGLGGTLELVGRFGDKRIAIAEAATSSEAAPRALVRKRRRAKPLAAADGPNAGHDSRRGIRRESSTNATPRVSKRRAR
jgi:transcriptional regulator with XRE-family HTH domain